MTAAEVRQIVEREIGDDWSRTNAHGCDFKRCLVEPYLAEFENCGSPGASGIIKLWVVLEEYPGRRRGYQIVFEEDSGNFGLALRADQGPVYLGPYAGGFLGTFDAM